MNPSSEPEQHSHDRLRAAMDRLLRGELPPNGKCDLKTLATEAGVARSALYTTYRHLKDEFEQRRDRLREAGNITDPREAQITRLNTEITALRSRLTDRDTTIAALTDFRTTALSRLAAQHEEILQLRNLATSHTNVRILRPSPHPTADPTSPPTPTPTSKDHNR